MMNKLFLFLLVLIIVPVVAGDLTIYPATVCFKQNNYSYELLDMFCNNTIKTYYSGEVYNGEFCVNSDADVILYAKGDLSDFLKLDQNELSFPANTKCINYTFELPTSEEIIKYGKLETLLYAETKLQPENEGMITILSRMGQQILVSIPYPPIYLEAKLAVDSASRPVRFNVLMSNLGKTYLTEVNGQIDVFQNATLIKSLPVSALSIEVGENATKNIEWDAEAGNYTAKLSMHYANKTTTDTQLFVVQTSPWGFSLSKSTVNLLLITMFIIIIAIIATIYCIRSNGKHKK